jgi:hypothetical protein
MERRTVGIIAMVCLLLGIGGILFTVIGPQNVNVLLLALLAIGLFLENQKVIMRTFYGPILGGMITCIRYFIFVTLVVGFGYYVVLLILGTVVITPLFSALLAIGLFTSTIVFNPNVPRARPETQIETSHPPSVGVISDRFLNTCFKIAALTWGIVCIIFFILAIFAFKNPDSFKQLSEGIGFLGISAAGLTVLLYYIDRLHSVEEDRIRDARLRHIEEIAERWYNSDRLHAVEEDTIRDERLRHIEEMAERWDDW